MNNDTEIGLLEPEPTKALKPFPNGWFVIEFSNNLKNREN